MQGCKAGSRRLGMKRWRGISVLLGAAVIPAALAGPLDPAVVDRNAGWMVHIDMEAALSSRVGGHMHAKVMKEDPQLFAVIEHDLGMNPTKAVKGVTMYGERMGADEGVVVLVTDEDADRWHRELPSRGLEGFARSGEGDSAANSWVVGGRRGSRRCGRGQRRRDGGWSLPAAAPRWIVPSRCCRAENWR